MDAPDSWGRRLIQIAHGLARLKITDSVERIYIYAGLFKT